MEARGQLEEVDSLIPCGFQDQSQVIRLGTQSLYSLMHLADLSEKPPTDAVGDVAATAQLVKYTVHAVKNIFLRVAAIFQG